MRGRDKCEQVWCHPALNGLYYQVFPETSSVYWIFHSSSVLFIGAGGTMIHNLEVFPFAFLLRNICQVATDAGCHGICSNLTLLWDLLQLEWPYLVNLSHFGWGDWDQGTKGSCPTPPTFSDPNSDHFFRVLFLYNTTCSKHVDYFCHLGLVWHLRKSFLPEGIKIPNVWKYAAIWIFCT